MNPIIMSPLASNSMSDNMGVGCTTMLAVPETKQASGISEDQGNHPRSSSQLLDARPF